MVIKLHKNNIPLSFDTAKGSGFFMGFSINFG
ncbi:hypothetical protein M2243_001004 [Heliophilum fasciatum]|nr:hypothetical protein [Heliophilum fasciatum]